MNDRDQIHNHEIRKLVGRHGVRHYGLEGRSISVWHRVSEFWRRWGKSKVRAVPEENSSEQTIDINGVNFHTADSYDEFDLFSNISHDDALLEIMGHTCTSDISWCKADGFQAQPNRRLEDSADQKSVNYRSRRGFRLRRFALLSVWDDLCRRFWVSRALKRSRTGVPLLRERERR